MVAMMAYRWEYAETFIPPVIGKVALLLCYCPLQPCEFRRKKMGRTRFSTRDIILIALMAAMGLAIKPLVKTFTHFISTPLGIPGGALTGGFYMMWLTLPMAITGKFGVATLVGLVQGIVVTITGWGGNLGAISLLAFTLPGIVIDLSALVYKRMNKLDGQFIYCLLANLTGTWIIGVITMRLPKE